MKKVLICDDSHTELAHLSGILEEAGCMVVKTDNGSKMVELCKEHKPDIVFLDIVMPEKDGYSTCRELTNDEDTKEIPVIFVSSKGKKADRMWAQMQGGRDLIQKPYEDKQILDQLASY